MLAGPGCPWECLSEPHFKEYDNLDREVSHIPLEAACFNMFDMASA